MGRLEFLVVAGLITFDLPSGESPGPLPVVLLSFGRAASFFVSTDDLLESCDCTLLRKEGFAYCISRPALLISCLFN